MFGKVVIDAAIIAMVDRGFDHAYLPGKNRMLMDFHVEVTPSLLGDLFILARSDTKERELAQGITSFESGTQKMNRIVQPIPRFFGMAEDQRCLFFEGVS